MEHSYFGCALFVVRAMGSSDYLVRKGKEWYALYMAAGKKLP